MRQRIGKNQRKILTLLLAGTAFALCHSPRKQLRILKDIPKELERINLQSLEYGLHKLYQDKHIGLRAIGNNKFVPYLTKEGRERANVGSIENLTVAKPAHWDNKWRLVFFDIPEKHKNRRDDFRLALKGLGFKEIQKSVICHPYPCSKEVMLIAEFLYLTRHIKYAVATELSDDQELRRQFDLP